MPDGQGSLLGGCSTEAEQRMKQRRETCVYLGKKSSRWGLGRAAGGRCV